jgi:hypothetical protein
VEHQPFRKSEFPKKLPIPHYMARRMRWVACVERMGDIIRNAYNIFVGKPEGKRALGIPRRRWDDNIRMDLRETGWEGMEWMHLAQVETSGGLCEYGNVPSDSIKGKEFLE